MKKQGLLGIIGAGIASLAGCTNSGLVTEPTYSTSSERYSTPANISNLGIGLTTNNDAKYDLERLVVNGKPYDLARSTISETNELPFYFLKEDDSHIVLDSERKMVSTQFPSSAYLPIKVLTEKGEFAHRIKLKSTGPYAVRAELKQYDIKNLRIGLIREDEKDAKFDLAKVKIDGVEWYTPLSSESIGSEDNLEFYMVPVESTLIDISRADGSITLISPNGIWQPSKISRESYDARIRIREERARKEMQRILKEQEEQRLGEQIMKLPKSGKVELIE